MFEGNKEMVSRYSWCVCLTPLKHSNYYAAGSEAGIFTCKPEELVGLDHRKAQTGISAEAKDTGLRELSELGKLKEARLHEAERI